MGTFCYDQYEHPLLWCDEKKRFVEKKNADESLMQWRQKKAQESTKKDNDKREYHDMSVKHCPWGKPGGGAPNVDVRRRDITAEGLHSTPGTRIIPGLRGTFSVSRRPSIPRGHCLAIPCQPSGGGGYRRGFGGAGGIGSASPYDLSGFSGGGGGAGGTGGGGGGGGAANSQIRSAADRLYITLKEHPSMALKNKGHVDIELRYKTLPKGKKMLEKIVVTEQDQCPSSKPIKSGTKEQDPWGKAGPGGKPWRNPKSVGNSFMHSLGWTNKELLKQMDDTAQDDRISSSIEKPKLLKKKSKEEILKSCCELCVCKCPVKVETVTVPAVRTKSPPKKQLSKELQFEKKMKSGSGYAGKSQVQKICPRYQNTLTNNSNVELVPLLARRRGMHRPISLSSTDVTKRTVENRNNYDVDLIKDLGSQMSQKRQCRTLNQLKERQMCNEHFVTFDTYWGRPGNGAPRDIKYKLNLDELLYGSCIE